MTMIYIFYLNATDYIRYPRVTIGNSLITHRVKPHEMKWYMNKVRN